MVVNNVQFHLDARPVKFPHKSLELLDLTPVIALRRVGRFGGKKAYRVVPLPSFEKTVLDIELLYWQKLYRV
jgi:hypothetical protein